MSATGRRASVESTTELLDGHIDLASASLHLRAVSDPARERPEDENSLDGRHIR